MDEPKTRLLVIVCSCHVKGLQISVACGGEKGAVEEADGRESYTPP